MTFDDTDYFSFKEVTLTLQDEYFSWLDFGLSEESEKDFSNETLSIEDILQIDPVDFIVEEEPLTIEVDYYVHPLESKELETVFEFPEFADDSETVVDSVSDGEFVPMIFDTSDNDVLRVSGNKNVTLGNGSDILVLEDSFNGEVFMFQDNIPDFVLLDLNSVDSATIHGLEEIDNVLLTGVPTEQVKLEQIYEHEKEIVQVYVGETLKATIHGSLDSVFVM